MFQRGQRVSDVFSNREVIVLEMVSSSRFHARCAVTGEELRMCNVRDYMPVNTNLKKVITAYGRDFIRNVETAFKLAKIAPQRKGIREDIVDFYVESQMYDKAKKAIDDFYKKQNAG